MSILAKFFISITKERTHKMVNGDAGYGRALLNR